MSRRHSGVPPAATTNRRASFFPSLRMGSSRKASASSTREGPGDSGGGGGGAVFHIHLSLAKDGVRGSPDPGRDPGRDPGADASTGATTAASLLAASPLPIPSQVHLDIDKSYDENIVRLTKEMGVALEADDDQLGYIFSLQHIRSKYFVENSMFCGGDKSTFWANEVSPGDGFTLRNEFERVDDTIAVLREALRDAARVDPGPSPGAAGGGVNGAGIDAGEVAVWTAQADPEQSGEASDHHEEGKGDGESKSVRETGLGNVDLIVTNAGAGVSIKSTAFRLRELLLCFQFAEEFIANSGIELLLSITRRTTGNAQAYTLRAMLLALDYASGLDGLMKSDKTDPIAEMYSLIDSTTSTVYREALALLFVIADSGLGNGFVRIHEAAEAWAEQSVEELPYASVARRIESPDEEARENAITLLNVLLQQAPTRKKKARLVSQFEDVGIYDALGRQLDADYDKVTSSGGEGMDDETPFQVQATFFQEATGHVIEGSAYEVEVYKKRLEELTELYDRNATRLRLFESQQPLITILKKELMRLRLDARDRDRDWYVPGINNLRTKRFEQQQALEKIKARHDQKVGGILPVDLEDLTASERIHQLQEELKQLKERFIRVAEDRDRALLKKREVDEVQRNNDTNDDDESAIGAALNETVASQKTGQHNGESSPARLGTSAARGIRLGAQQVGGRPPSLPRGTAAASRGAARGPHGVASRPPPMPRGGACGGAGGARGVAGGARGGRGARGGPGRGGPGRGGPGRGGPGRGGPGRGGPGRGGIRGRLMPTKPEVKPRVKMRALHWDRILLGSEESKNARIAELEKEALMKKEAKGKVHPVKTSATAVPSIWLQTSEPSLNLDLLDAVLDLSKKNKKPKSSDDAGAGGGTNKAAKKGTKKKNSTRKLRVVDPGRAQTVAITLSKLPEIPVIVDSIDKLDDSKLSKANIDALIKLYPTADELKAIADLKKARFALVAKGGIVSEQGVGTGKVEWDRPERLFMALGKIPSCTLRLTCWSFERGFDEMLEDIKPQVGVLLRCCEEIRNSSQLRVLMGTVLAIGNYMNGGTRRGRADGFKVEALERLYTTKISNVGSAEERLEGGGEENGNDAPLKLTNTLIDLVAHQACVVFSNMASSADTAETKKEQHKGDAVAQSVTESGVEMLQSMLKTELGSLEQATKVSMNDVKSQVQRLLSHVQKLNGHYARVVETTNQPNDPFNTKISDFLAEASKIAQSLSAESKYMDQEYCFTVRYFTGHDRKKSEATASEAFFGNVLKFVDSVVKAAPVVRKKKQEARQLTRADGSAVDITGDAKTSEGLEEIKEGRYARSKRLAAEKQKRGGKVGGMGMKKVMEGIKLGVHLKKTQGPQKKEKARPSGLMAQLMNARRMYIVPETPTAHTHSRGSSHSRNRSKAQHQFGYSDDEWDVDDD